MKFIHFIIFSLFFVACSDNIVNSYSHTEKGIIVNLNDGTLAIYPLTQNTVRIKFLKDSLERLPELILTEPYITPEFKVIENASEIEVYTKKIKVLVNKKNGNLSYADSTDKIFLREKPGTRKLISDTLINEKCYLSEQSFISPSDEFIFGLGQFQDGNFNLKGISRRLTQVNSQIALPFIYSSKGYGILWHQYGLTDFNPAGNRIELKKIEQADNNDEMVEVTTTTGAQKVSLNQSLYTGKFKVAQEGEYSIFLNLGEMGNRHFVTIDGNPILDQSNMWLPPTAGTLVHLNAGEHEVQLICKSDNTPELSWKLKDNTTTFRSPVTKMLDYVVFYGPEADTVIATYRKLSGIAPLFPKWAYGFWQCRERYTSGSHLVETLKEFRQRKLPVDVIVQDWQYWGNRGWGVPQFDETNYANPSKFIQEIHDLNAHFNISIWSNPDKNSDIGKKYVERDRFIPGTKWLDYFNPDTRREYWTTLKENMFDFGVDSWWMDAVEPENDALKGVQTHSGLGDFYRLTYPLMVSQAVYEGQREITSEKRVCILTRSAFLGQQRYGIINWSGDIGGNWDAYRRQIVAGLNYSISGLPYWTTDIGGFFRPGNSQYSDTKYHELLLRWFQWGAFNPIFRSHGFMSETEPWKYGAIVEDNMRKMLNLRYRLLPYIYSEAWKVTHNGSSIMRPLVMDFKDDSIAVKQAYQYMFGKSIMVAPVTEAEINEWTVYLPEACNWFNFYTGDTIQGGKTIKVEAPLDKIPLFIKAGSIIPVGSLVQYSTEKTQDNLDIYIYRGADAEFILYEDENDNYNYEKGAYTTIRFLWNDVNKSLTIGERTGDFQTCIQNRRFNLILVDSTNLNEGFANNKLSTPVNYTGKEIKLKL
ncbi:MAG: DUF5110 domain-containing protein [Bacteroidales bacterium]|nr:DUF5110 domain-containing protein [Bacteroidales bacterium]MBN2820938.1 DUF5110 domain-containing protein [Bacteroidales bacterium]